MTYLQHHKEYKDEIMEELFSTGNVTASFIYISQGMTSTPKGQTRKA